MAEKKDLLVFRFTGPLQAWGEYVIGDVRSTADFPTKSGVVGLISCAMGLRREDPLIAELSKAIEVAFRADRKGRIVSDFHTITESMQANGQRRESSILAPLKFIEDGCFTVFVSAEEEWLERIDAAMKRPVWRVYLGRVSCPPAEPVYRGRTSEYKDMLDAIMRYPLARRSAMRIEYEMPRPIPGATTQSRQDARMPGKRNFASRLAWRSSFMASAPRG